MHRRECVDETFDAARCENYDLLAQASEEGFALAVVERLRKRFIAFVTFPMQVTTPEDWASATNYLQTAFPWVKSAFNKVALCYRSRKFTLVPTPLFNPLLAKPLLSTAATVDDLEEIHFFSPAESVTMVYAFPTQLSFAWKAMHPDSLLLHPDGATLKVATCSKHAGVQIFLTAKDDFCTLIATQEGRLLAAQPIDTYTPEDVLYFCTATLQALTNNAPTETSIRIAGNGLVWPDASDPHLFHQLKTTDVAALLKRYYKVSCDPLSPVGFEYSYTVEKIRGEASSLFLLAECV